MLEEHPKVLQVHCSTIAWHHIKALPFVPACSVSNAISLSNDMQLLLSGTVPNIQYYRIKFEFTFEIQCGAYTVWFVGPNLMCTIILHQIVIIMVPC